MSGKYFYRSGVRMDLDPVPGGGPGLYRHNGEVLFATNRMAIRCPQDWPGEAVDSLLRDYDLRRDPVVVGAPNAFLVSYHGLDDIVDIARRLIEVEALEEADPIFLRALPWRCHR